MNITIRWIVGMRWIGASCGDSFSAQVRAGVSKSKGENPHERQIFFLARDNLMRVRWRWKQNLTLFTRRNSVRFVLSYYKIISYDYIYNLTLLKSANLYSLALKRLPVRRQEVVL
jgi:hypothetical protein